MTVASSDLNALLGQLDLLDVLVILATQRELIITAECVNNAVTAQQA